MGSDRARVSYDPSRHWRGVINQQGRVTLEADWNEAAAIAAEAERAQLVDVIGPSGTPDDGYAVVPVTDSSGAATGDLTIRQGTLYVGGERMVLDADLDYAKQPDWIDSASDTLWVDPAVPDGAADEAVYLLLREQEVGAVEDPALLDIALGGPDTSERLRIVQRVLRHTTAQTTCSGALGDLEQAWAADGLTFDAATMRLDSAASLQVSFQQPPGATTPCEPVAQGGYLGAENQLIRVQVASVDANGVPTLVWGFDNAYFLYRIAQLTVDEAGGTTTVMLASAPVDSYHQPQAGQAVEVLEAAAELTASDYIAATTGIVTTAASAYQPDTQQLVLSTALTTPATASPLLFLRVWQEAIAYTGSGPVALADTGIQVTLGSSTGVYHAGDYWVFAVRPGTPTVVSPVYPQRILDAPQPPDGPRLWACQLAVVAWASGVPTVTDCRQHFSGLTSVTGEQEGCCCTIEVSPDDVGGGEKLQELINRYASLGSATICLQPGIYALPRPLVIKGASDLTIRGCAAGVRLEAAADPDPAFRLGLVLVDEARGFTLRGLELAPPLVGAELATGAFAGVPEERQQLLEAYSKGLDSSIGVYLLGGTDISIESCTFSFDGAEGASVFGAGVFAATSIDGLQVENCTFSAPEETTLPFSTLATGGAAEPPFQVRFGYLQVPTPGTPGEATAAPTPVLPTLANASFERNVFDGLTVPVLVIGQIGTTRVEDNTVRSCYGGFWLLAASDINILVLIDRFGAGDAATWKVLVAQGLTALADPILLIATAIGRTLPAAPAAPGAATPGGVIVEPSPAALAGALNLFHPLFAAATAAPVAAAAASAVAAEPTADVAAAEAVLTGAASAAEATGAAGAVTLGTAAEASAAEATTVGAAATGAAAAGVVTPGAADVTTTEATTVGAATAGAATTGAAAGGGTAAAGPLAGAVFELPDEITHMFVDPGIVDTASAVPAADPGTAVIPRLDVSANQIDAVIADSDSGAGLFVFTTDVADTSSLICSNNRIRGRVAMGATLSLQLLVECTVTGNIVSNEIVGDKQTLSVSLNPRVIQQSVPAVAVTGNVLLGPTRLPARALPAPLNVWDVLNTVTPFVG